MSAPTLLEWMGGPERLQQLITVFYARVQQDSLLAPVFAGMSPQHARRVSAFIAEVFGGAKEYSRSYGGHHAMVLKHAGRALTEAQRRRWMSLLLECADEVRLPTDPEFRSAFVAYIEWGTRLAVINSRPGADLGTPAPMPTWGWGETGGPYVPDT